MEGRIEASEMMTTKLESPDSPENHVELAQIDKLGEPQDLGSREELKLESFEEQQQSAISISSNSNNINNIDSNNNHHHNHNHHNISCNGRENPVSPKEEGEEEEDEEEDQTIEDPRRRAKSSSLCHGCGREICDRWIMKLYSSGRHKQSDSCNQVRGNDQNGNTSGMEIEADTEIFMQLEQQQQQQTESATSASSKDPRGCNDENCLLFHENCLRCSSCSCLLDRTCFVRDSKLFCPFHYYK